jgi:hypothetical protein
MATVTVIPVTRQARQRRCTETSKHQHTLLKVFVGGPFHPPDDAVSTIDLSKHKDHIRAIGDSAYNALEVVLREKITLRSKMEAFEARHELGNEQTPLTLDGDGVPSRRQTVRITAHVYVGHFPR